MPERHAHYRYHSALPLLVSGVVACSGTNNPSNDASMATTSTPTIGNIAGATTTSSGTVGAGNTFGNTTETSGSGAFGTTSGSSSGGGVTATSAASGAGTSDSSGATSQGGAVSSAGGSASTQGGATTSAGGSMSAGGSGIGGSTGGAGGSVGVVPVEPPVSDTTSDLPIANPGGEYEVDGNIPYGELPAQRLDVMYPRGGGPDASSRSPGVIMFHGGGWIQGDKATMSSFYSRFLAHGFVVCSAEYRVANGSPEGGTAPAAVEDALLAAKWFWNYLDYYNVDRSRYVVTGASAGGHLALMVGMATPEAGLGPTSPADFEIAAIVNGYGPSDVPNLLQRGTSWAVQWLPANTPNRDELALLVSPHSYVRADIAPLLTVHGSEDTTVPVAQSQSLNDQLQQAGADADLHLVEGAGHGFSSPGSAWPDAESAIFEFLTTQGILP